MEISQKEPLNQRTQILTNEPKLKGITDKDTFYKDIL